jgi:hypothetical protein
MTDAPDFNEDFADILAALIDAQVEFLVVGAHENLRRHLRRSSG